MQHEGDAALLEYTQRFDRVQAESVAALEIPRSEWLAALDGLPQAQRAALEAAERMLTAEGFLARRRELNRSVSGAGTYELCVLESEAQEARQLIMERGF